MPGVPAQEVRFATVVRATHFANAEHLRWAVLFSRLF